MDKLTDSEIVKALECCCEAELKEDCEKLKCPFFDNETYNCMNVDDENAMYRYARDLINRLHAENERLKDDNKFLQDNRWKELSFVKAEAYKEFAERLKKQVYKVYKGGIHPTVEDEFIYEIDNLLKEMVGENNATT